MKVSDRTRGRRKLALMIAEQVDAWIRHHDGQFDVDECAKQCIYCANRLIPDSRAELQADLEAIDNIDRRAEGKPRQPSLFGILRGKLYADDCSVSAVLRAAIAAVEERDRLKAERK